MLVYRPAILFIDAYDSFTNNIISLLTTSLACSVRVIHIDSPGFETDEAFRNELQHYDAVVCGPGPGDPSNHQDVGLMKKVWKLKDEDMLPALGICLGFQSLCLAFGGNIQILNEGLHGRVRRIHHIGEDHPNHGDERREDLFNGVGELRATLYHSLYIATSQNDMRRGEWEERKWKCVNDSGNLLPLAWAVESESKDKTKWKDDPILMAVRHDKKPFWGVQYHPESICTNKEGKTVILNWFMLAQRWNRENGRTPRRDVSGIRGDLPTLRSLLSKIDYQRGVRAAANAAQKPWSERSSDIETVGLNCHYESRIVDLPDHISVPEIMEKIQDMQTDHIILESSNAHIEGIGAAEVRGRYSIIGLDVDDAVRIEYHANRKWAEIRRPCLEGQPIGIEDRIYLKTYGGIWPLIAYFLEDRRITDGDAASPFWGGFMGYTTYELGLEGIGLEYEATRRHARPDLCFAWITRSLVLDHLKKKIYVQQLVKDDLKGFDTWLDETVSLLRPLLRLSTLNGRKRNSRVVTDGLGTTAVKPSVTLPKNNMYESKVRACQEQIRRGESYELCLTDQTQIILPRWDLFNRLKPRRDNAGGKIMRDAPSAANSQTTAWSLYKSLRRRNPAPFASFIRLGVATFVSGSPERFLKWNANGKCELRPMKGTVKKTSAVSTLPQAEALLQVPKEQAENLMIVDLVRHDLHSVCGPGNVTVPRLMAVEEYTSVFQMISVVEGQIPQVIRDGLTPREVEKMPNKRHTGVDVLAASLPPGSMTGAPKKRSCEILREIEAYRDRSLYSGVVGYMDVGGRGDFSVNIRCMFRWDDEGVNPGEGDIRDRLYQTVERDDGMRQDIEVWHIGAGGAVTALSTPVAEREEMQTKLMGTLGVFGRNLGNA